MCSDQKWFPILSTHNNIIHLIRIIIRTSYSQIDDSCVRYQQVDRTGMFHSARRSDIITPPFHVIYVVYTFIHLYTVQQSAVTPENENDHGPRFHVLKSLFLPPSSLYILTREYIYHVPVILYWVLTYYTRVELYWRIHDCCCTREVYYIWQLHYGQRIKCHFDVSQLYYTPCVQDLVLLLW